MKNIFKKSFVRNFLYLFFSLFFIEIIFKLLSGAELISFGTLRIALVIGLLTTIVSFGVNFANKIISRIINLFITSLLSFYACFQLGFYNFIGVYASVQTSSQLGAVTDYISDFFKSFEPIYFLTFIPFIIMLFIYLFMDKKKNKINLKHNIEITLTFIMICVSGIYVTIIMPVFQNKLQAVSNKKLFLTASNPSLTIEQYGTFGFFILDMKSALIPYSEEETYEQEEFTNNNVEEPNGSNINVNKREIDDTAWKQLIETESNNTLNNINKYLINRKITDKNEYTGLFEGKNLIVILMESANDILKNPDYYPNFSKMINEGWYWENNYSPRNSCATMNNEFSGMTSLYSIYNTCTASKYKKNTYSESLFNLFNEKAGYKTFSAHDYTEAYYPRKTIHTNMGSQEYYGVQKLGIKYANEYVNWANDDEFFESVLNIIDKKTLDGGNFMTWLTTVSSHQPYSTNSIQGNKFFNMTSKTKYPTDIRRYMSKLKILDNAFGVLLDGLDKRGILDDTVIVLYGDHYPYGISTRNLNKVLDYDTSEYLNAERVPFVIYNHGQEPKVMSDYTSYINIVPTLANLFNLDYDPRLYLGTDLFSNDYKSLVVFADGSWKNEYAYYNAPKNKIHYFTSNEYSSEEIIKINNNIDTHVNISNKIITNNYFKYLKESLDKIKKENEVNQIVEDITNETE